MIKLYAKYNYWAAIYTPTNYCKLASEAHLLRHLLLLCCIIGCNTVFAQREFAVCDSTSYTLNDDTTIIAGRYQLYLHTNNITTVLYNFASADVDEYIRDFDIISPNLWYTVVGLRYIGGPARLYKSTNKGQSWVLDTNHFSAVNTNMVSQQFLGSINNMQQLNGDTLLLFVGYYESGILYSVNKGQSWTMWFNNLISHYQGMFECNNKYYIFGYEGDAFRGSMFGFDKNLLFTSDSAGQWSSFNALSYHPQCYQGNDAECIYAPGALNRCQTYYYFKNKIDSICFATTVNEISDKQLTIYPSPFYNKISVKGAAGNESYTLINPFGQTIWTGKHIEEQDFTYLPQGLYFLITTQNSRYYSVKLFKE